MEQMIQDYFRGILSPENRQKLFEELDKNPALKARFVEAQHARLREAMRPTEGDEAVAREGLVKLARLKRRSEMRRNYIVFSRYAAAVLLFVAIGAGILKYTFDPKTVEMAEATAPAGKRMELQLADGTKVWLAPRSTLIYPVEFSKREREVEIVGEALFDVTPNAKKPFEVHSGDFTVRVLGTMFSTSSLGGEFETVLISGAVEVSHDSGEAVKLQPGERAWMENGTLETGQIDLTTALDLQSGVYSFERTPLAEIVSRLAVWHGVEIRIDDPTLAEELFCAKFRDGDDIDTILRALQRTGNFDFSRDPSGAISIRRR
jgi:ferric-dicitrate binding protein FerR (iron transport regulator)